VSIDTASLADDHDLERRLRQQRPVARDEFVQGLAGKVRDSRGHPTAGSPAHKQYHGKVVIC